MNALPPAVWRAAVERLALAALPLEGGVAAAIECELSPFQVENPIDGFVEQIAVVADDDHRARVARDMRFQPQRRFEVEIVGRLVQQQQVGLGEQRRRERNPHAPAAGEFGTGALLIGVGKAQAGEDFRCARGCRMRSDVGEPALDFGDAGGLALRVRFGQELGAFGIGLKHDLEQALRAIGRFLGKPADAIARRDLHMPLLGRELAGDDAKERGLAGAVATD